MTKTTGSKEGHGGAVAAVRRVVVFFGLVASGKSTLAKLWAVRHGFPYANSDVVRKGLAGAPGATRGLGLGEGIYSAEFTRRTYDALAAFAAGQLSRAPTVVLDGSYHRREERDRLRQALSSQAAVLFVLCHCGEAAVKARLAARAVDPDAVSDGDWRVYLRQRELFEEPTELPEGTLFTLCSEESPQRLARRLDRLLGGEGAGAGVGTALPRGRAAVNS